MGQLEKYGLYVMCLVIFLILGVTLWGEPANASKTKAKEEAAMHASIGGNDNNSLSNVSFDPDQQRRGGRPVSSLLGPEDNPPRYEPDVDNNQPRNGGGGVVGNLLGGTEGDRGQPRTQPQPQPQPQVDPAPQPKTEPVAARRQYTVKRGDSFARIAKRELGSERHTALLTRLNKGVNPAKLQIGQKLTLPGRSELGGSSKTVNKDVARGAYRTYTVSKGDTFDKIARVELGSIKRVRELRAMNSSIDPRRIQIGQVIKLPLK